MPRLDEYDAKRDFAKTPEPRGRRRSARRAEPVEGVRRFVVQEHHARSLHWDLRLEHDGALASWAVPKGIPVDPGENHLAVRTEDHPMEYLEFHGEIPRGQYGAGTMTVWDRGDYETYEWEPGKVVVRLAGERVRGRYALFRTNGRNWMIHRMDPPEDPDRVDPPADFRPMRAATAKRRPSGPAWAFEMAWRGRRVSALVQGGRVRVRDAGGDDLTAALPELRGLGAQLGSTEALLDGVVVVIGVDGRPDDAALGRRLAATDGRAAARLAKQLPAVLMIFDLVWLDGRSLEQLPYEERRRALEGLGLGGPAWQTPPVERGDGARAVDAARRLGFEGVVAKRLDAPYEPGKTARTWLELDLTGSGRAPARKKGAR
ncbi:MAG TPA: DNA polymerase ligase N-terminal domain-containing protein [Acidimicrobiia bacterium]|nr:DNA polymerase ligase N-terminal domain-containing protein [Acidimicrobiia bacterium]